MGEAPLLDTKKILSAPLQRTNGIPGHPPLVVFVPVIFARWKDHHGVHDDVFDGTSQSKLFDVAIDGIEERMKFLSLNDPFPSFPSIDALILQLVKLREIFKRLECRCWHFDAIVVRADVPWRGVRIRRDRSGGVVRGLGGGGGRLQMGRGRSNSRFWGVIMVIFNDVTANEFDYSWKSIFSHWFRQLSGLKIENACCKIGENCERVHAVNFGLVKIIIQAAIHSWYEGFYKIYRFNVHWAGIFLISLL